MIIFLAALAVGWTAVSRHLQKRHARGMSISLVRGGGLVWMVILVMILTMPWRLLFLNDHRRALLHEERVYIILERGESSVLYDAEQQSIRVIPKDGTAGFEQLDSRGYVFESAEQFATDSGC
jgi:hypothetical protein